MWGTHSYDGRLCSTIAGLPETLGCPWRRRFTAFVFHARSVYDGISTWYNVSRLLQPTVLRGSRWVLDKAA